MWPIWLPLKQAVMADLLAFWFQFHIQKHDQPLIKSCLCASDECNSSIHSPLFQVCSPFINVCLCLCSSLSKSVCVCLSLCLDILLVLCVSLLTFVSLVYLCLHWSVSVCFAVHLLPAKICVYFPQHSDSTDI